MKLNSEADRLRDELRIAHARIHELDARLAANVQREREAQNRLALAERISSTALLTAGAAYQLQGMATYVLANIEYATQQLQAQTPALSDDAARLARPLGEARDGLSKIRHLLGELLEGSSDRATPKRAVDIERLLLCCIKMARTATEIPMRVVTEFTRAPEIVTDETRLSQALLHLLVYVGNVVQISGHEEPVVRVATRSGDGIIYVDVSNDDSVFDRSDWTGDKRALRPSVQPEDLGLSICHHLAQCLGGSIQVTRLANAAMLFTFGLPIEDRSVTGDLGSIGNGFSSLRPERHRFGRSTL